MNRITTYLVNSFTDESFKGNPAGVCILQQPLNDEIMLKIAQELALSETAFIHKSEGSNQYNIRFFSPKMEIPLCGHATLAASKVLFERNPDLNNVQFTNIQKLNLSVSNVNKSIQMEFPIYETSKEEVSMVMLTALGLQKVVSTEYNEETKILILELDDCQKLQNLEPDFEALHSSNQSINGVLVTAESTKMNYDFECRYFWPWSGTNEDPVTGAIQTFLAKYWNKRIHKTKMNSFQCSKRTGFMEVELMGNKVVIKSQAMIVLEGELRI